MNRKSRENSRKIALFVLYQMELLGEWENEDIIKKTLDKDRTGEVDINFLKELVQAVKSNRVAIDKLIQENLIGWDIERLNIVDKTILRIGVAQLITVKNIPYKVAISESVNLAKIYCGDKTPSLINGVLDTIAKKIGVV